MSICNIKIWSNIHINVILKITVKDLPNGKSSALDESMKVKVSESESMKV